MQLARRKRWSGALFLLLPALCAGGCRSNSGTLSYNELRQIDREQLERRVAVGTDRLSALCIQGERLAEAGAHAAAEKAFSTALALSPNYACAQTGLLMTRFQRASPGYVEVKLRRLIADRPGDAAPLLALGELYLSERDAARATGWFRRAEQANPTDSQVAYRLGQTYGLKGRSELAIPLLIRACEAAPRVPRYHLALAEQFARQFRWREAKEQLSLAEKWGKPTGPLRFWQAKVLLGDSPAQGTELEAKNLLKEAMNLSPGWLAPRVALARLNLRLGEHDRAVQLLEMGLPEGLEDDDFALTLAQAYSRNGRRNDAKVIEAKYRENKRAEQGVRALTVAAEDPNAPVTTLRRYAREMQKQGAVLSALDAYRRILTKAPLDSDARNAVETITSPPSTAAVP